MDKRYPFLKELGLTDESGNVNVSGCWTGRRWVEKRGGATVRSNNPTTNETLATVPVADMSDYDECLNNMRAAAATWQATPAPKRGEIIRAIGDALREKKDALGSLVTLEMGKILAEGKGEVQEFIDICDLACGSSRSYAGQTLQSERPGHVLLERWNPLGEIGVITAFNYPVAVYGWNLANALMVGDSVLWKPSATVPLTTVATMKLVIGAIEKCGADPAIVTMCVDSLEHPIAGAMVDDARLRLISFTGSTKVGRTVAARCALRFARTILELGGNNGIVAMDDANLDLLVPSVVFGSVGTAGQRCTTTRRLFLHKNIYDTVMRRLVTAYAQVPMGDPLDDGTLMGPLHTERAVDDFVKAVAAAKKQGGKVVCGGAKVAGKAGNYVQPTIIEGISHDGVVMNETFVPILYVFKFSTFEEAVRLHNSVNQGLSSALFTERQDLVWQWTGAPGSDCGLANVNVGTSGAEIGGAFGSAKEGIGSEAGSDSWKQYCRRTTSSINYSKDLPLAQGIKFSTD